jgi:predicted Zn-dependent protease
MLIVQGDVPDHPWDGRVLDVRVDHHDRPLDELQRLIRVAGAFRGFGRGVDALFSGDAAGALEALEPSLAALPDEANLRFVRAGALLLGGRTDEARATLRELIAERPSIEVVVRSFAAKGLLALPAGTTVDALLSEPAG